MVVKTSFNTDCLLMSGKISIFAHSRNRSVATIRSLSSYDTQPEVATIRG